MAPRKEEEEVWCVHNDPCGMCCVCVTYGLIIFADYGAAPAPRQTHPAPAHLLPTPRAAVVCFALLIPWYGSSPQFFLHCFLFLGISLLAVTSHMRCMLTDPGTVPSGYSPSHLMQEETGGSMPMCSRLKHTRSPASWGAVSPPARERRLPRHAQVQWLQASARAPLLSVRPLRHEDGPPLSDERPPPRHGPPRACRPRVDRRGRLACDGC